MAQPLGLAKDPTKPSERADAAAELANACSAVVVLKGNGTIVTDGHKVFTNATGSPVLATAGTGDVLTGLIAGLIAQGMKTLDASVLAVHLHGLAGDIWVQERGPVGLTASDLARLVPSAIRRHQG